LVKKDIEGLIKMTIASTYRIIGEIGSGGGGVVYLAEHLRLGKKVVLKADRRTLTSDPAMLRREVDALKDLSHTYIPQVYDFLSENGTVYTVMDYIEGESFDKALKRGERFSQAQVVEWACQLLEALQYLHNRPPHGILHADIKPANVMLTPAGDIRLIDFNIALSLGAEGTIAVGRSFGYASPEHYGLDYTSNCETQQIMGETETVPISDDETVSICNVQMNSDSGTYSRKCVMLDVRSDIYSIGATLYHILSGNRPPRDAKEVPSLPKGEFSAAVLEIIAKAMNPNPDLRYQSAAEMLYAFEHLRENDPRTRRYKRVVIVTSITAALVFLIGGFTAFVGLNQIGQVQSSLATAEYSENALRAGDVSGAVRLALQALPDEGSTFAPPYTAEAQKALADALGIYDLSDGFKSHQVLELKSEPLKIVLSPDGKTGAALYAYKIALFNTETSEVIKTLPVVESALADFEFIGPDVLVYAGSKGIGAFNIARMKSLWTGKPTTEIAVSANGKMIAAVNRDENVASVYDSASGKVIAAVPFGNRHQKVTANDRFANPNDNLFALNEVGTMLAVSFSDGSLTVFNIRDNDASIDLYEPSEFTHFEGGFFGKYLAFSATNNENSVFTVIDTVELKQTGGFSSTMPFHVQADKSGIHIATENVLVRIDPVTGEQTEIAYTGDANIQDFTYDSAFTLVATDDTSYSFFDQSAKLIAKYKGKANCDFVQINNGIALIGSSDEPTIRIMNLESHADTQIFSYDPSYQHDEARVSADGSTVMLFRYDNFRLFRMNGELITEVEIPDAEQVYDQQYRRDDKGSYLEVTYNNGMRRLYSATTGEIIEEKQGEKPDLSLREEFLTDDLRITGPLHETPVAYDRKTGEMVRKLEKDAYLTYVTQVGKYIITEYVSTDGDRYGLLLNDKCETLAKLPYLCDIYKGKLYFDYKSSGVIRQSRIYSIQELTAFAKNMNGRQK
jgi:serine/threonine protein kinase